jgi:hypothetical protein
MFGFLFSAAFTVVILCLVLFFFWAILAISCITLGVMMAEDTHNVMWYGLTLLGLMIGGSILRFE